MQQSREKILREAEFHARAVTYRVWSVIIPLAATILFIPFLPLIAPVAIWYQRRYYACLRVVLTSRDLKIHRGVWVREEKTIPLEKITDLRVFQGPMMRYFNVTGVAFETAGQQSAGAALATIHGIVDTEDFRDQVLAQRDRIADSDDDNSGDRPQAPADSGSQSEMIELLTEIRDSIKRIEQRGA